MVRLSVYGVVQIVRHSGVVDLILYGFEVKPPIGFGYAHILDGVMDVGQKLELVVQIMVGT